MLGSEVTKSPNVGADNAVVSRVCGRVLRQNELEMLSGGSRLYAAGEGKWVRRCGHRDELDARQMNAPQSLVLHVYEATDGDACGAAAERALDFPQRFDAQTQWYRRKSSVKTLKSLDEASAWQHPIHDH
jgi:hypothetical protein